MLFIPLCHRWLITTGCAVALSGAMAQDTAQPAAEDGKPKPASPANQLGPDELTNSLGMKFRSVPGTTVLFSVYETRVSDFATFLKLHGRYAWSISPHFEQSPDHPVVGTSLQDALAFANWLTDEERNAGKITRDQGYRLPTPKEWSAAVGLKKARHLQGEAKNDIEDMEDERTFPWGLDWPPPPRVANLAERDIPNYVDGHRFTAPVGSYPPTADGLFDMSGNVWEWTWDRELIVNPKGTLRGGSWAYFRRDCLTSQYIYEVPTDLRAPTIGFRIVYEDKRRTAVMLAQAGQARVDSQRRDTSMVTQRGEVDKEAVAALLKSTSGGSEEKPIDPKTLKPAALGKPYSNALGLAFIPIAGKPVLMGKTEVTQAAIDAWQKAIGQTWTRKPSFENSEHAAPQTPIVNITWDEAVAFCDWLTEYERGLKLIPALARYRLPSDLEWSAVAGLPEEKGADPEMRHLADTETFPWGKGAEAWPPPSFSVNLNASNIPKYTENSSYTTTVGKLAPNDLGFDDLGGNVSEWCLDTWPGTTDERVIRGASWLTDQREAALSSARQHRKKDTQRYDTGFRCVLDLTPAP